MATWVHNGDPKQPHTTRKGRTAAPGWPGRKGAVGTLALPGLDTPNPAPQLRQENVMAEMRCPCGCIMVWTKHGWLCIHCDLSVPKPLEDNT